MSKENPDSRYTTLPSLLTYSSSLAENSGSFRPLPPLNTQQYSGIYPRRDVNILPTMGANQNNEYPNFETSKAASSVAIKNVGTTKRSHYPSALPYEPKTQNAIASARSREKRKRREDEAYKNNERLSALVLDAEKRNNELIQNLESHKLEHFALRNEAEVLRKSQQLDRELNEAIINEITAHKSSNVSSFSTDRIYKPLQLAQKQLKDAEETYAVLFDRAKKLRVIQTDLTEKSHQAFQYF